MSNVIEWYSTWFSILDWKYILLSSIICLSWIISQAIAYFRKVKNITALDCVLAILLFIFSVSPPFNVSAAITIGLCYGCILIRKLGKIVVYRIK